MAARRTSKRKEYPAHIITMAKAGAGILGVTPIFGDEDYMMKQRMFESIMAKYEKERCGKCKKATPNLGWKEYMWLCKECFVGPKTYTSNEE